MFSEEDLTKIWVHALDNPDKPTTVDRADGKPLDEGLSIKAKIALNRYKNKQLAMMHSDSKTKETFKDDIEGFQCRMVRQIKMPDGSWRIEIVRRPTLQLVGED